MRLSVTFIVAIFTLGFVSQISHGQTIVQLEAPEPDITTFHAGEYHLTTSDTKNDINIRILDDAFLINYSGYTMYNNEGGTLTNDGTLRNTANSTLYNDGTLNNDGTLGNIRYSTLNNDGTLYNDGTLNNSPNSTLNNDGTLYNDGTLNNYGTLNNSGTIRNYSTGTINGNIDVIKGGKFYNGGMIQGNVDISSNFLDNNNSGIINGNLNLKSGGMIGNGTINGSVTIGGLMRPGFYVGSLITGNQTWIDGGAYRWQINDSEAVDGFDVMHITATAGDQGVLDLSQLTKGGFGIQLVTLNDLTPRKPAKGFDDPNGEYEFVILTTVGGITGFDAENFAINDYNFQNSGTWDWSIEQDGNNLVLSATGYTLVPEPSSTALLALGGLAVMLRRKPLR